MTIKRCYPVLVGASVAENQLVQSGATSVTAQSGHKYYAKINGTESLGASTGSAITINDSAKDMVTDLTKKLGSTIADYAYTLEQATAGSGIAWLRSYGFITDDYKPYNTGTIESVEATAKVVRDENNENAVTYPLGSDTLRGIFKLDANNNLYADGDRKEADGTITRRYGVVDLGTLTWNYVAPGSRTARFQTRDLTSLAKSPPDNYTAFNGISSLYEIQSIAVVANNTIDMAIGMYTTGVVEIRNSAYTSASDFKTAMSGVMLVYELATPTTETSTPFTSPQIVYPDGTEEFVTENGVTVGHETKYQL